MTESNPGGPMYAVELHLQAVSLKLRPETKVGMKTGQQWSRLTELLVSEKANGKGQIDFLAGDAVVITLSMNSWDDLKAFLASLSAPFAELPALVPEKTNG